ncbi:MAG: hypothetical protein WAQ24_04370 [Candidatus Saccharimonadales bacterium]
MSALFSHDARRGAERLTSTSREQLSGVLTFLLQDCGFDRQDVLFGYGIGAEGVSYADTMRTHHRIVESPLEAVAGQPAWASVYFKTHDLAYSLGAVVGAFAQRSGIDLLPVFEKETDVAQETVRSEP